MNYLLGIDFGGGASKATLMDTEGRICAEALGEYPTVHPTSDACEQLPADWLSALRRNCAAIFKKSGIRPGDILAVALDSATHSFVVCGEDNAPLRPAIHWTDSRSRRQAAALSDACGDEIFRKTYHKPDTIWTLPQLLWLREQEGAVFEKIRRLYFEKDYIREYLTGVFCTDYIEAEGSMLYDCTRQCWDAELCALCGISPEVLPPIVAPTEVIGAVTPRAAAETGLQAGTPVICGTTDTVMEVFASGAVCRGNTTVKLATAGRICVITDRACPDRHLVNYSHIVPGLWYPGTATKAAAASYRWFRDIFHSDYATLDREASAVAPGCEGMLFLPHINGELTPYADPVLCGSFTGIRSTHTRGHFARAVLEGVSLSLLDCKRYLDGLGIVHDETAVLIGGGARGDLWGQITADMLGMTLRTVESSDSSFGSAMLAGIALGVFSDAESAAARCVRFDRSFTPNPENTAFYAKLYGQYKELHDALAPIYQARSL